MVCAWSSGVHSFSALRDLRARLRTVILLAPIVVLHFDHLDNVFEDRGIRTPSPGARLLGDANGLYRVVEQAALLLQHGALHTQGVAQGVGVAVQHGLDPLQGDTDELERNDLLQSLQVARAVEAVTRLGAARPEQAEPVVVVQRPHGNSGEPGEILHLNWLVHADPLGDDGRA